ncbi:MAG: lamin tail domain-containing protein [Planctomycetes bacterium]|nr:lamin tail domain-containing protein [Planctomycetota bacterium]
MFEVLEPRLLLDAGLIISEFMANNASVLKDAEGDYSDWIEIYNSTAAPVNLEGWCLRDSKDTWEFPAGASIGAKQYLVVFASGKDRTFLVGDKTEYHASIKLDADGEYLGLIRPDGTTPEHEYYPEYPAQVSDVSYGIGQSQVATTLVDSGATAQTLVPTGDTLESLWYLPGYVPDGSWTTGPTGVGYDAEGPAVWVSGFQVRMVDTSGGADGQISDIGEAQRLLNGTTPPGDFTSASDTTITSAYVNFGSGGTFGGDLTLPNGAAPTLNTGDPLREQYALRVTARLTIPVGSWTIDVGSDDGFMLTLSGITFLAKYGENFTGTTNPSSPDTIVYGGGRSHAHTGGNFTVTGSPQTVTLTLDYYENIGGDDVELSVASGLRTSFRTSQFALLGDGAAIPYTASVWTVQSAGVSGPDYSALIGTDTAGSMYGTGKNTSAYVRIPFTVADASGISSLNLRMKYDDGFVVYLNGHEVARVNAPDAVFWNSAALSDRGDDLAIAWEDVSLTNGLPYLVNGENLLAFQGLNDSSTGAHFLVLPVLEARGASATLLDVQRYFTVPTPGEPNGEGTADLGPVISNVTHTPTQPADADNLVVTSLVRETFYSLNTSTVTLHYRVMYGTEQTLTMTVYDDGLHGDGQAGDGLYFATAAIPAAASAPGQMVRYYVTAADTHDVPSRWPLYLNPNTSAQYLGTVVVDPSVTSALPILQWFVENPTWYGSDSNPSLAPTRTSVYYDGRFYDNATVELRGGTALSWRKHHFKFKFNPGEHFTYAPDQPAAQEININSSYSDKSYLRTILSWETYEAAGVPGSVSFPLRVQQNGTFFSVAFFVEEPEDDYLDRLGLDDEANLYKLTSDTGGWGFSAGAFEQKNGTDTSRADLSALVAGLNASLTLTGDERIQYLTRFLFDNFDVPEVINYYAASTLTGDTDNAQKNYYLYHSPTGNGEWQMLPWDKDLTFGRNFVPWAGGVLSDEMWADMDEWQVLQYKDSSRTGTSPSHPLFSSIGRAKIDGYKSWNPIIGAFMQVPEIKEMYLARLRTLMDQFLQVPGTPYADRYYETRIDELYNLMLPDVLLDRAKWGNPYGANQDFATAVGILKSQYLDVRRTHLYVDHSTNTSYPDFAGIPAAQPARSAIQFGVVEWDPAGGNQDEEYIELVNPNNYAVDLSGWKLRGAVEHTFDPGVVIPAGGSLYVSPNVVAFRARATGPRGGRGLFVQGNYNGHLSGTGETVRLLDEGGNEVASYAVPAKPLSAAQQYLRVAELMYHPQDPAGGSYSNSDFEYVELQNIGPVAISLEGVRFSEGICFTFPFRILEPGARVLVVANQAAFESRYGSGYNALIAGEFVPFPGDTEPTRLGNGGETLELDDFAGAQIQQFRYNDTWYTQTDGLGFSLVARDPAAADLGLWDSPYGWRASRAGGEAGGSPGTDDVPSLAPESIVINELLSHTDIDPPGDWVELLNAGAAPIDVSGWYLSDEPLNLMKYRIPDLTPLIQPGGYMVLTQYDNFGVAGRPGVATPFAFSELGDAVYLTSGAGGGLGDYQVSQDFGAAEGEVSFIRYVKPSTGGKDFTPASSPTRGGDNAAPQVGPIVINEIMYNPQEGGNEFIELYNPGGSTVLLYDPAHTANTWKFTDGLQYAFPTGSSIPAGGYALVVSIDPAVFRAKYGIPGGVQIFGPFDGTLSGSGESIELSMPGNPEADGTVPYYRVDRVTYNNAAPWPTEPDGHGPALARLSAAAYGNDVANWEAGHTGGTPGAPNAGTIDRTPPTDPSALAATVISTSRIDLSWTGSADAQTGVAGYVVRRNGAVVALATGTAFSDTTVRPSVTYSYEVSAINGDGVESGRTAPLACRAAGLESAGASDRTNPNLVRVVFTETVQAASAQTAGNYTLTYPPSGSVTVTSAVLGADGRTVTLTTSTALAPNTTYTLSVSNVQGQSGYAVIPNSQKTFKYEPKGAGGLLWEYWTGIGGSYVANLTDNANYPDSPTGRRELPDLDALPYFADSYGSRMRGYVTAPQTGNYIFWIASDDNSELWLNAAGENPDQANLTKIAYVGNDTTAQSTNWKQWGKYTSQQSAPIWLVAGQRYYIEVRHKEGGGADCLSVGWQLPDGTQERPIPASRLTPYDLSSGITITAQASDAGASETGPDKGTFTISRTGNLAAVMVYYTIGGTAGGDDYREALSGYVMLGRNVNSATIDLTPVDDALFETSETVVLTIAGGHASYAVGATPSATIMIADDDVTGVSIVATDPAASEAGPRKGVFTVTRAGDLGPALTVNYTVLVGSTASPGDYQALSGTVTIAAGQPSAVIEVTPVDDDDEEPPETLIVGLLPGTGYQVGSPSADVVTIDGNEYPTVTAVRLNGRAGRGPGSIDPSGIGVQTIEVDFSEAVTFTPDDVTVQAVDLTTGETRAITPVSVLPLGDARLVITLPDGSALDTWVKVTLLGGGTLLNLKGSHLDGEPAATGSGRGYIYDAGDLPTGDGTPGGDAVFYVGSLRGDLDLDRAVTAADKAAFAAKWRDGNLDADFRGVGFGPRPPDGRITIADINGFTSAYQAGLAAGRHLDELPLTLGGSGAAAGVTELPALTPAGGVDILAAAAGQVFVATASPSPAGLAGGTAPAPDGSADDALQVSPRRPPGADGAAAVMRI